jgi:hypothetical protein
VVIFVNGFWCLAGVASMVNGGTIGSSRLAGILNLNYSFQLACPRPFAKSSKLS